MNVRCLYINFYPCLNYVKYGQIHTSRTLSTETISFSVSVKLLKKLPNKDTIGAAYESANPTCKEKK